MAIKVLEHDPIAMCEYAHVLHTLYVTGMYIHSILDIFWQDQVEKLFFPLLTVSSTDNQLYQSCVDVVADIETFKKLLK